MSCRCLVPLVVRHLLNLAEDTLAKQVLNTQIKYGFPGLVKECQGYIQELELPDISDPDVKIKAEPWKRTVKAAIRKVNESELKKDLEKSKKVYELSYEKFETKDYFKKLNLVDARTIFKQRAKMMEKVKMNYSSDPKYSKDLWMCDSCQSSIDTQSHVLWCPAYVTIRENKNLSDDKDLAKYLQEVLKIRTQLHIKK